MEFAKFFARLRAVTRGWPERGAMIVLALFLASMPLTLSRHNFLGLPPAVGMMSGQHF